MQVVFRSLLAATLLAWVASCSLNDHGLSAVDAGPPGAGSAGHPSGAAGASAAGAGGDTGGVAGTGPLPSGAAGDLSSGGATGAAGDVTTGATGAAGDATAGTTGAAGDAAAGTTGAAGGAAGAGGSSTGGVSGAAGGTSGAAGGGKAGAAGTMPEPGCSDGTREGFLDQTKYPNIAACAGAWDKPGLGSTDARAPQCDRRSGNDGDKADGHGCSVADLCASGWRVCESAHAVQVATMSNGCDDAFAPSGDKLVFFVTRQRATQLSCDSSTTGANNLYGCGNFGSAADKTSCAPFTRMLRDSDCQAQQPWACSDGPPGTSTDEYNIVTKTSSSHGGALCCKD